MIEQFASAEDRYPTKVMRGSGNWSLAGFRVVKELGRGGMGIVYAAEDLQLRREVAIKVMRSELVNDDDSRQRFLREAQAIAAVNHENIVPIHQVGESADGSVFLVMPLLTGETLSDWLRQVGRLHVAEVVELARQILAGLAVIHARGLIHRDVKPSNIWIESYGGGGDLEITPAAGRLTSMGSAFRVRLLDFGLARTVDHAITATGEVVGSPEYMSPEQSRSESLDARSDLFSVGAVLYQCLTGLTPFHRDSLFTTLKAVQEDDPTPVREACPDAPAALTDLIEQMLRKSREHRPGRAYEVLKPLRKLTGGWRRHAPATLHDASAASAMAVVYEPGSCAAIRLEFRKFVGDEPRQPAYGELHIQLTPEFESLRGEGVAALILRQGLPVLRRGDGPIHTIVVEAGFLSPTLDDMLATTFATLLLEGKPLKPGCGALAQYAKALREGLQPEPDSLLPEERTGSIFLAIRNAAGTADGQNDLTVPEVAERFRRDWKRMEGWLLEAAERKLDPVTERIFPPSHFARERAFIKDDRMKYLQDVSRGQRWLMRLPGREMTVAGLFLKQPESLLFPMWAHTDREAPLGTGYLFLAVWSRNRQGENFWLFTTNPTQQVKIKGLAELLCEREQVRNRAMMLKDSWYDGHCPEHDQTLVESPRAGTLLPEREVLSLVKRWGKVRGLPGAWRQWSVILGAIAAFLAAAVSSWISR